jgi:RNA polymerase sigma factor for flagellar operon FliA
MSNVASPAPVAVTGREGGSTRIKRSVSPSEQGLWMRYRLAGDPDAGSQLAKQYLGLVRHVIRSMVRLAQIDPADLESAGMLGLLRALDGFDPSRGLAFSTYAVRRIRGAILDDLRARDTASRSTRGNLRRLAVATSRLEQRLGRPPRSGQVAEALGIDLATLWRWQAAQAHASTLSLDDAMGSAWFEAGVGTAASQECVLEAEQGDRLQAAIARLPERERAVVVLSYYEGLTLRQIGDRLEVTESRVSQIRSDAVRRLRALLVAEAAPSLGAA